MGGSQKNNMTIGIDIGGSKIRGILWSSSARWNGKKILKNVEFSTPKSLKAFEKTLKRALKKLNASGSVKKIGIGVAGVIKNNKVISATNIKYLKNYSSPKNYKIDNDARCFARAEYILGAGYGTKSVLVFTLGTGIGRAYGKNGKILKIKRFEYAEDWEKDYQKIHSKKALSEFLGEKLKLLIDALNPEIIILGGGVVDKKGYYETIKRALNDNGQAVRVKKSKLGKFAGAIGAALLFSTPY